MKDTETKNNTKTKNRNNNKTNTKTKGKIFIRLGLLLIAAALLLTAYNLYDAHRANESVDDLLGKLKTFLSVQEKGEDGTDGAELAYEQDFEVGEIEIADYILNPNMDMPEQNIDGEDYIGVLEIPSLALELPIISRWNDARLRTAPCRYVGSVYTNDMVIAGHNYDSHFGRLKTLSAGDELSFTDMAGNEFRYCVVEIEILQPTAIEEMQTGDWDLTLFTCTIGGRTRVTVRCELIQ